MKKQIFYLVLNVSFVLLASSIYAQVDVIVATTGDKSDIGHANDSVGFMYSFAVSENGNWWVGEFELDSSLNSIHVRGQGTNATEVIWAEGDSAPGGLAGTNRRIFTNRQTNINDSGHIVGLARHQSGGIILGEYAYRHDGNNMSLVASTGESIPALTGAVYEDLLSPNIGNNGQVSFLTDNISGNGINIDNDQLSLTDGGASLGGQRKGVTTYDGELLERIDHDRLHTDSVGNRFILTGDTVAPNTQDDLVVVGDIGTAGNVVLRENVTEIVTAIGNELFDVASHAVFGGDDWFVAGDTVGGTGVVIRNGVVIASEGDLAPDGFNYSGEPLAIAADDFGNFIWVWDTDNPDLDRDLIMVYNGDSIVVREHDVFSFDIDSDGANEEIRMDRLFDDFVDLELAGNYAYFMTEIDDPVSTVAYGWAFLRVVAGTPQVEIPADVFAVENGTLISGDIDSLSASDNADLSMIRSSADVQSRITLVVEGSSINPNPTSFGFHVESSVFARSEIGLFIDLYDFQNMTWENVHQGQAQRFVDSTTVAQATGDLSRFVNVGGSIKARIRFASQAARQSFAAHIDHLFWMLN